MLPAWNCCPQEIEYISNVRWPEGEEGREDTVRRSRKGGGTVTKPSQISEHRE